MLNLHTQRPWRAPVRLIGVALLTTLAACGGGHDQDDTDAQPPVTQARYVSFEQGDPGLPGDGITVSIGTESAFHLSTPVPLGTSADGFTITAFVPRGSPAPDWISLQLGNGRAIGEPCRIQEPETTVPARKVEVNGVAGLVSLYTPARIAYIVAEANAARGPACPMITASDISMRGITAGWLQPQPTTFIFVLDAVAVDPGIMQVP